MLIDWFTVGAQALNFLVLVFLMRRFLYKPILHAIDAREKLIAKELADADAKEKEAGKEREEFKRKNAEFEQQRAALLVKVTDEVNTERQRLLDEARKAADALSEKRGNMLRSEAHDLSQAIGRRTQHEVLSIARKALKDLATVSLEERLGEVFTRRLREMDGKSKESLGEALKSSAEPALVRSAFELPVEQRAAIQNALNETFSVDCRLRYEVAPELVSGIELTANGQKVAWSITDYLTSLGRGIDELLKEREKPPVKVEPKPDAKVEPKSDAKVEPKSDAMVEARPDAKVELKPVAKVEPKPVAKVESKSDAKVKPKPDAKVEPKPDAKAESRADAKAGPETKIVTKTEQQPSTDPEAQKTETKSS